MSDPKPLKVITCLYEDGRAEQCGALVEDTDTGRRAHRAWHSNDKNVKDALRSENRQLRAELAELRLRLADTQRDVETFEVPAPILPIEVNAHGWTDDDEPDTNLDDVRSTYADDNIANTIALDPDDLPTTHTPAITYGPGLA